MAPEHSGLRPDDPPPSRRWAPRQGGPRLRLGLLGLAVGLALAGVNPGRAQSTFQVEEATIADIQRAILAHQLTTTQLVKLYLARIKAYNGPGVEQPQGWYGPSKFIAHAKGINALSTLNLRPATRTALGFDAHHARSMTDLVDNDPNMPDALEVAAKLDEAFARTGRLVGPLHGVVMAIKDQYDTFDLRTTSGTDAFYANDRPPHDATFVQRLRAAGAIILAKANVAEDASGAPRSAFGGTFLNPYDTERSPSGSSSGSGSAVAANLVTCAIGEETTTSVRGPAHWNCDVGLAPTQELISRYGMMGMGLNTRVGPITRTVEDCARILTVIAGYDRKDPMTAFVVGRLPEEPYEAFTHAASLRGLRIGVVREYMDKRLFTKADEESIDLIDRAIDELRKLGATIFDPGEHGELFTSYIRELDPQLENITFTKRHPAEFPVDAAGRPLNDQIAALVDMAVNPALAPGKFTLRDLGAIGGFGGTPGESRFEKNLYWRERGDAAITNLTDRAAKANYYSDPAFPDRKPPLLAADKARVLDTTVRLQRRFAVQTIILQAFADLNLDAVVYPTGSLPPSKLGAPAEPTVNGRSSLWTFLGTQGFPAITVPAGFTTHVYDRVFDPSAPPPPPGAAASRRSIYREDGQPAAVPTILVGPVPAVLPVGVDFLGAPFSEPTLFKIAAAYEHATKLRHPPPDFGPLASAP